MEKVNPDLYMGGLVTLESLPEEVKLARYDSLPQLCTLLYYNLGIMSIQSIKSRRVYKVHYKHIKEFKDGIKG